MDQAVLALLSLGRHEGYRTWKAFDWEVMGRLHQKGYISDPVKPFYIAAAIQLVWVRSDDDASQGQGLIRKSGNALKEMNARDIFSIATERVDGLPGSG